MDTNKSDILIILENIDSMFNAYCHAITEATKNALALAIAQEANMLQLKLSVLADRWAKWVPFKEACDVDFDKWGARISKISSIFSGDVEDYPECEVFDASKNFFLDFYNALPLFVKDGEEDATIEEDNYFEGAINEYNESFGSVQEMMSRDFISSSDIVEPSSHLLDIDVYKRYITDLDDLGMSGDRKKELLSETIGLCDCLNNEENCNRFAVVALHMLSYTLTHVDSVLMQLTDKAFSDMVARLENWYCYDTSPDTYLEIKSWLTACPKGHEKRLSMKEIEKQANDLRNNDWLEEILCCIDLDKPSTFDQVNLGKVLFKNRSLMSREDAIDIIQKLIRITMWYYYTQQEEKTVVKEQKITVSSVDLDVTFSPALHDNKDAAVEFVRILKEEISPVTCQSVGRSINKWKWWHVRRALIALKYVDKNISYKSFGESLAPLVGRTEKSIEQSCKADPRTPTLGTADSNIIKAIVDLFSSVEVILKQ